MAVYVYDIRNERTIKKNDRTEEQGNERTNEPWSSKRRHHEFFDFSSTPPPPPPFLSSAATCSHDQFHLEEVLLEQMLL